LRAAVQNELNNLTNEVIASLTGWQFILDAYICSRTLGNWYNSLPISAAVPASIAPLRFCCLSTCSSLLRSTTV
jgi:hypothetical protein